MGRGRFIVLEGAEGAGKTSSLETVRAALENRGRRVVHTREPGGTSLGERIRELLVRPRGEPADACAETLLLFAARAQHVAAVIAPALARGDWVLCDRFTDSTFAYQAGGGGVDANVVRQLADIVHPRCWPDLTLYLDVPPAVGLARATRASAADRFEREPLSFHERVRATYRARAEADPRTVTIDASQPSQQVRRELITAVHRFVATQDEPAATPIQACEP